MTRTAASEPVFVRVPVETIREGDPVDLSTCPYLHSHPIAEMHLAEVVAVCQETPTCVVISYEGVATVGYRPGVELQVIRSTEDADYD